MHQHFEYFSPDDAGTYSLDSIVERLWEDTKRASRISSRFVFASLFSSLLYFMKIIEYNASISVAGQNIFSLKNADFVLLLTSLFCMAVALIKETDSSIIKFDLDKIIKKSWPEQWSDVLATFPDPHSAFKNFGVRFGDTISHEFSRNAIKFSERILYLILLFILLIPFIFGIHFICMNIYTIFDKKTNFLFIFAISIFILINIIFFVRLIIIQLQNYN